MAKDTDNMLFGNAVDRLAGDLRQLRASRQKLADRAESNEKELRGLRAVSPDEILDGFLSEDAGGTDDRGTSRARIVALEMDLQDIASAQRALASRFRQKVLALGHERAEVVRSQAKKLEADYAKHVAKRNALIKAVEDFEGGNVRYGEIEAPRDQIYLKDGRVIEPGQRHLPMPKSWQLQEAIRVLLAQADGVEAAAAQRIAGGMATGSTLDEILSAVQDPETLSPLPSEVSAWFAAARATADQEWQRDLPEYPSTIPSTGAPAGVPKHGVTYQLFWDSEGRIDKPRSTYKNRPIPTLGRVA